jgi:hypothetical protein
MAIDVTLDADITAVLGASGSGKSAYIKKRLRTEKPQRLLIYDPEGEFGKFGRELTKISDVLSVLQQAGDDGAFKLVFNPHADPGRAVGQFELLCRMAFHAGNLMFVVEELADVTQPTKAPVGWSMLTRRGRKRGCRIIGASQRPASIDKTFLGNCTRVRCGRLMYEEDARAVGKVLGVDHAQLLSLPALHFFERCPPGEAVAGVLKF